MEFTIRYIDSQRPNAHEVGRYRAVADKKEKRMGIIFFAGCKVGSNPKSRLFLSFLIFKTAFKLNYRRAAYRIAEIQKGTLEEIMFPLS
jgi:hypothetical protein